MNDLDAQQMTLKHDVNVLTMHVDSKLEGLTNMMLQALSYMKDQSSREGNKAQSIGKDSGGRSSETPSIPKSLWEPKSIPSTADDLGENCGVH